MSSGSRAAFVSFDSHEIDGKNIKSTDEKLIANGPDVLIVPEIDMMVRLGSGKEYTIKGVTPILGGDSTPIVWIIQARKNG